MAQASKTTTALPKEIFKVEVKNHELLKVAYEAYLANARKSTATTKTRGEVRGGGKKPWRQKGTGRARFGSIRNPIWRTGGIVFGPRGNENYTKTINKSAKKTAIRQALTLANESKKVHAVENLKLKGKTKEMIEFLKQNKADDSRRVLVVVDEKTTELMRAANNIQSVTVSNAMYLNVYHILNADKIFITKSAIDKIKDWLGSSAAGARK
jgi:large subunit ribosomal protein L4